MPAKTERHHGYGALRKGRWSQHDRDYFLTICLLRPSQGLTATPVAAAISAELTRLESEGLWQLRTSVIMPDQLHLLVTLKDAASLSNCVRLFKGRLAPTLRAGNLRWQPSFYDHCIRSEDDLLPVFLYVFLNPYRAGLADANTEKWPYYFCAPDDWEWFGLLTREQMPFPEWLQ